MLPPKIFKLTSREALRKLRPLKWLYAASFLGVLILGLSGTAHAQSWMNSAWQYRTGVSITNPNGNTLTNFQTKVTLDASFDFTRAQSSGADLRVTTNDGVTTIPFWIADWRPASSTATIWVQIPSIPTAGASIWLYYGNSVAVSASSGRATFTFFDDFEASPTSSIAYFPLSAPQTVFVSGGPGQLPEPHTMSIVEANSGGYAYAAYIGQASCAGVGVSRSSDLVNWTAPVRLTTLPADARWPSVLLVNGTYYMTYTEDYCTLSHIALAKSTDGINFTRVKSIVDAATYRNQNSNLFFNPNDQKYYIYWFHDELTGPEIHTRSASTIEGLSDTSSEVIVLRSTSGVTLAAPNMLYSNGLYFLSTEVYDPTGQWATKVFYSALPTSGFQPVANGLLLSGGNACMFQHIFNNTLHNFLCTVEGTRWTMTHRTAPLTVGNGLDPTLWAAAGDSWKLVTDTQQDGTTGRVLSVNLTSTQTLNSTFSGTDYVLEGNGRQINGRVWGLGVRANSGNGTLYSASLYDDLYPSNNLYTYLYQTGTTPLTTASLGPIPMGAWYNLAVKVHGNQIDVYKDGALKSQAFDGTLQSGAVALMGQNGTAAEFNNVFVRQYAPTDPAAIVSAGFQTSGTQSAGGRVNVAAAINGSTASGSSTVFATFAPAFAIDGERKGISWGNGGGWNDATQDAWPDWLQVDFAGPQTIDEVDVFNVQDAYLTPVAPTLGMPFSLHGLTDFQVQYWNGSAWVIVPGGDIRGNNQVWRQVLFAPITTSKIRIYVTQAMYHWTRITEVEAWAGSNTLPGALAKSSPANAAAGQSVIPTLAWAASSGATSYEYCMDTTNNNSCDTGWTNTTGNSAVLSALNLGTTYFWQVRARNGSGTSEANSGVWWSLTTGSVSRINVAAAANGARPSASSFYSVGYAPGAAINGERKGIGWGSVGGWNDSNEGIFPDWLQVDFSSLQSIDEVDVFTVQDNYSNPAEPVLGMPFSLYGITAFQVQYWDGSAWVVVPGGDISGNNQVWRRITFGALTTSKIRINVTGALNAYSRITEVEAYSGGGANALPGLFVKNGPTNTAIGQPLISTPNWGASNGATSYEYCLDTINNNSCDTTWTSTAGTSAVINGLSFGTTYWWQVRARNGVGTTDANAGWWSLTTLASNLVNVAAATNGSTVTASSFYNAGYGPSGVINGDRRGIAWSNGGGWNDGTASAFPDSLQINFASSKTISEVDVFTLQDNYQSPADPTPSMTFSQYGITDFQVQYWDGTQWLALPNGVISGNTLVWRKITFPALTTTSIRIIVTGALNSYSRIVEVEAY